MRVSRRVANIVVLVLALPGSLVLALPAAVLALLAALSGSASLREIVSVGTAGCSVALRAALSGSAWLREIVRRRTTHRPWCGLGTRLSQDPRPEGRHRRAVHHGPGGHP